MRRSNSKQSRITLALICASAVLAVGGAVSVAQADPVGELQLNLYDCTGPAGTPSTFDVVHMNGPVVRLIDGRGAFVVLESFDETTNTLRFTTAGLAHNSRQTVTCWVLFPLIDGHPLSGHTLRQTGILTGK